MEGSNIMKVVEILLVGGSSQAAMLISKGGNHKTLSTNGGCAHNMNPMKDRHSNMNHRSDTRQSDGNVMIDEPLMGFGYGGIKRM